MRRTFSWKIFPNIRLLLIKTQYSSDVFNSFVSSAFIFQVAKSFGSANLKLFQFWSYAKEILIPPLTKSTKEKEEKLWNEEV